MTEKQLKPKKKIFSGIKPSGSLSIGNYIGAISQWVKMQDEYNCTFSIVDYHAITVKQDPKELHQRILEITKIYLASGIDLDKSIIFQQSTVAAHTELAWILNCYGTHIADLNKMTQFKSKAGEHQESVSVGLYDYPVLMAADILLYDTDLVPVGEDQKQHVELARDIARRFNHEFKKDVFKIPQPLVRKQGARIMSLLDPHQKMSKSTSNPNSFISLLDDVELAKKKIKRAITDSGSDINYGLENKPALSNLLTIYAVLGNREIPRLVKDYQGQGYGQFKEDLSQVVAKFLENFQKRYYDISDEEVKVVLEEGRIKAEAIAQKKLGEVKKLIGVR